VRILLLDHDESDAAALAALLEPLGIQATIVSSLHEEPARDVGAFEAVVVGTRGSLDDRAKRCRELREGAYLGALVGVCVDVSEGAALLEAGADDFVTAASEAVELSTRLRACVSRVAARSRLRWGSMELDQVGRVVRLHGRSVSLTNRECGLLACLIQSGGGVVSRATLRERVWHRKEDRGTNLVEVHLSRLREKLGADADKVETVRRAGYRLRR
jgi:DNA-binding response OmpR family regulator